MSIRPLSRDQVRRVDAIAIERYGLPGLCLMENAGRGAAEIIDGVTSGKVSVLCGPGNNGGDGFVIARHLENWNRDVDILLLADPDGLKGDAEVNWHVSQKTAIATRMLFGTEPSFDELFEKSGCIVDAMLGTGSARPPSGLYAKAITAANNRLATRVAIDIPTGLDCDTGDAAEHCFVADHTLTFVAPKIGFQQPGAAKFLGEIHVVDIGAPRAIIDEATR